jgi:carbonic anhydrase
MSPIRFLPLFFMVTAGLLSLQAHAKVNDAGVKVSWGYVGTTGPTHWGMLDPDFETCDIGKSQSPINLGRKRVRAPYNLALDYHATPLFIGEDLDTTLEIGTSQTMVNTGHGLQINFHGKERERLTFAGKDYELVQFHFHSPSETLWHKQAFPLEIHFVHQGKDGAVAVLAVFVKGGAENPALKQILQHLPENEHKEYPVPGVSINPVDLLPADQRYFSFQGSLTTPPCTEGLQWIAMPETITASPAQILEIRQTSNGTNARPVQPMNDRTLYYSVK